MNIYKVKLIGKCVVIEVVKFNVYLSVIESWKKLK